MMNPDEFYDDNDLEQLFSELDHEDILTEGLDDLDIDEDMLMELLDHLGSVDSEQVGMPSHRVLKGVKLRQNPELQRLLIKNAVSSYWANPPEDITKRPKICLSCIADDCQHIMDEERTNEKIAEDLEMIGKDCPHNDPNLVVDDTCVQCMIDFYKNADYKKTQHLVWLWDSLDLADYAVWMYNISFDNGMSN